MIKLGVPLQCIDVEGMEVWKYYFSRGYTHVKGTKFKAAESYERHETINLFFDDSEQMIDFRYSWNLPPVMTDEAEYTLILACLAWGSWAINFLLTH